MNMNQHTAATLAAAHGIPLHQDFHALPSDTVARIVAAADAHKYRAPKAANGSRARYFYAALCRAAAGPKTATEYVVQQCYGGKWEDVTAETSAPAARRDLRDYRRNQPEYPARLICRRVAVR